MSLPRLRAASLQFETMPEPDSESDSRTGAKIVEVAGPLKKPNGDLLAEHPIRTLERFAKEGDA